MSLKKKNRRWKKPFANANPRKVHSVTVDMAMKTLQNTGATGGYPYLLDVVSVDKAVDIYRSLGFR